VEIKQKGNLQKQFPYWVAENIRKIKPIAPDTAIEKIVDKLKGLYYLLLKINIYSD